MGYFTGELLNRKIKEYSLENIAILFSDISEGKKTWGGSIILRPENPTYLDTIRIIIYSILHRTALKPYFNVKFQVDSLIIDSKLGKKKGLEISFVTGKPVSEVQDIEVGPEEHLETIFD